MLLDILCHMKIFTNFWVITCGIRAEASNIGPECSSTCLCGTVNLNKHGDVVFFWMIHPENFVSELMTGMDRLEEYADEESPYTERNNFQKEAIQEEITNNSLELLQTIKELKIEMESVKKENERILRAQEELNQI